MSSLDRPQPRQDDELRDDLLAVVAARRELSPDDEKYLVESFLDRLDQQIEARVDARVEQRLSEVKLPRRTGANPQAIVPAALGIALPLSAVAAIFGGVPGLIVTWIAIAVVVFLGTQDVSLFK